VKADFFVFGSSYDYGQGEKITFESLEDFLLKSVGTSSTIITDGSRSMLLSVG
jgi:hypothetical protein